MQVEQLISKSSVEALDVRVLIRFAWLDVLNCHSRRLGPLNERFTEKFRAIVGTQDLRQPTLTAQALEDSDQSLRSNRCIDFDVQRLAIEIVNDIEQPKATTTVQGITHEIG